MMNPAFSNDDVPATPTALDESLRLDLQNRIRELTTCGPVDLITQADNSMEQSDLDSTSAQQVVSTQLSDHITYSDFEICKTILIKHEGKQIVVICVSAGDVIPTHKSLQGTAISVLSGQGVLDLDGQQTVLEPNVFAYIPPQTFHSIRATEDLAMLCVWA